MNWLPAMGLALAVSAPLPRDAVPKKADSPALVGVWACDGVTDAGRALTEAVKSGIVMEFTPDGKVRTTKRGKPEPEGIYSADPMKSPPEVDFALEPGGDTIRGIYKVDTDTLTLCFEDAARGKRPTVFAAPPRTILMLLTFKRIPPKKE